MSTATSKQIVAAGVPSLWERLQNILRVEEPATLPQLQHWLLNEFSVREIDHELEEMRAAKAVTMELIEEGGKLQVIWWYGDHRWNAPL